MKVSEERFAGYRLVWPTGYHTESKASQATMLAALAQKTGGKVVGSVVKVKE